MCKIVLVVIALSMVWMVDGKCERLIKSGVSSKEKTIILEKHNALRLDLAQGRVAGQPQACNLKRLKYDEKLAAKAQEIANTCIFAHVKVPDSRFWYVGQNLGSGSATYDNPNATWENQIQNWFNEHKNFQYPNKSTGVVGHYKQVIWHDTTYIGCGYAYHYNSSSFMPYTKLYVCNYGPGTYRGAVPYQTLVNGKCDCKNLC